jgi:hypothetical protein
MTSAGVNWIIAAIGQVPAKHESLLLSSVPLAETAVTLAA